MLAAVGRLGLAGDLSAAPGFLSPALLAFSSRGYGTHHGAKALRFAEYGVPEAVLRLEDQALPAAGALGDHDVLLNIIAVRGAGWGGWGGWVRWVGCCKHSLLLP